MPGTQVFTYANVGKETTRGTPVAPTRMIYADGTGVLGFDYGLNFHEAENAGVRTRVRRATQQKEDVALKLRTAAGVSFDELVVPFSFLNGTATGTGGAADKTWTQTPSMTASNAPASYTVDVGDETQNFRCQYGMARKIKLGAARGDVTSLEMEWFAQRALKVAKATPALNVGVKIPGDLWTIKFATTMAGLPGASVVPNFLIDWNADIDTGLVWRHYLDGNLYGSQHVETDISGKLMLTVESTAQAISEFYDKMLAQTMDFIRLKATGPALGGTFYSAQMDFAVLYEEPEPISGEDNGVNLYKVTANLAYDSTSATSFAPVTVNSLTTLP